MLNPDTQSGFGKDVPFSFAEREDFNFEGELFIFCYFVLNNATISHVFYYANVVRMVPSESMERLVSSKRKGPVYHEALLPHEVHQLHHEK